MAYGSVRPQLVRRIDHGKVYEPFYSDWECDPCALPGRRYRLTAIRDGAGEPLELAWWDVILPEDDARTRYLKWRENRAQARIADEARRLEALRRRVATYGGASDA